ncbi:MAG: class I SAM-dependent methyltransferase [Candidatus Bathyarchaeota archaeon]|nr:class I SAM-dependent methyltransferase [Candidatus Bathyarchaeota archaeon]
MTFEQDYFNNRNYQRKAALVRRHVLAVLQWASKASGTNLLDGHGKRALDVGCAFGYTSGVLAELGYETYGTDISAWGTKQAKQQTCGEFLVCDAQNNLPFSADTFDLVTCFDVLEHLPNPEKALQGMFDAVKTTVICTTPNRKVEKPIRTLTRDYDPTHINVKTPAQWRNILTTSLPRAVFVVDAFFDFALGGAVFWSFRMPTYGLTVRLLVNKQPNTVS